MSFFRSKAEQLADYLRGCWQRRELVEPLPGTRTWSKRLGVSRATLDQALRQLQREGLIAVSPCFGVRLAAAKGRRLAPRSSPRLVRGLYPGRDYPDWQRDLDWTSLLSQKLQAHDIQLSLERCDDARLCAYARQRPHRGELFCLISLPEQYQRMFAAAGAPAVLVGEPAAQVRLPFVSVDLAGAIRHATQTLLRGALSRVVLAVPRVRAPGILRVIAAFESACHAWPHQPVRHEVVRIPVDLRGMVAAASRFARTVKGRHGVVVFESVPVGLIMTALMRRGVAVGEQVRLAAVLGSPESLRVCPVPVSYPYPAAGVAQALAEVARHYFESGAVPPVGKHLPTEMVPGLPA